jgi:hypothetical protein
MRWPNGTWYVTNTRRRRHHAPPSDLRLRHGLGAQVGFTAPPSWAYHYFPYFLINWINLTKCRRYPTYQQRQVASIVGSMSMYST